jgi:dUTP pyrophosphatase
MSKIPVQRVGNHDLPLPMQMTAGAAGYDLRAVEATVVRAGERKVIPTGFAWSIPDEFAGQIWPRSGIANKFGIDVLAGLIDPDYNGEVKVILINHGDQDFQIEAGDRVAQMMLTLFARSRISEVPQLAETERGADGFGSTLVA